MGLIQFIVVLAGVVTSPPLAARSAHIHSASEWSGPGALQRAIDAATSGDTVMVPAGTYHGNITLNKRVALLGMPGTILQGDGKGSVVTIAADSCEISGFRIERSGGMLVEENAGILVFSDRNTISNNTLHDVLFGIYVFESDGNNVVRNEIRGREFLGLGERGSGIHVWNSNFNCFVANSITGVRDGFYIQNAHHSKILDCTVWGVRYGLHYMYADSNRFVGNDFHDNTAGAAIMYSRGITMRRNLFVRNRGVSSYGILFQDCHGVQADSNIIADNLVGLFFEASTNNVFRHNIIARNDVAFQMFQNSSDNVFTRNNIIDNINPLTIVGKRTDSYWSNEGQGNYWSFYDGYDLDADGIGDIPVKVQTVFEYLEGRNPNIRLFLYSPASQALATASKAFPILDVSNERDPAPLMRRVNLGMIITDMGPAQDTHKGIPGAALVGLLLGGGLFWYRISTRKRL
jgi:nitrous oxidase accessory protein